MKKTNFDMISARLQQLKASAPAEFDPELVKGTRETIDFLTASPDRMAAIIGVAGVIVGYNPSAMNDIIQLGMMIAREEEKKAA
jgi:hypothetical protein